MSQNKAILDYLKTGNSLTGMDALKLFGTMKLASRISEIKDEIINEDFFIDEEWVELPNGKRVMKYWISERPRRTEQEEIISHNFHTQETKINLDAAKRQWEFAI